MHLCGCVRARICVYVCLWVCVRACVYVCMLLCFFSPLPVVYICMYVNLHVCMYVCSFLYMYACMYACMYVFVCVCCCAFCCPPSPLFSISCDICACICIRAHVRTRMYVFVRMQNNDLYLCCDVCVRMFVRVFMIICALMCKCSCVSYVFVLAIASKRVCACVRMRRCMHTNVNIHMRTWMCKHTCVYTQMEPQNNWTSWQSASSTLYVAMCCIALQYVAV